MSNKKQMDKPTQRRTKEPGMAADGYLSVDTSTSLSKNRTKKALAVTTFITDGPTCSEN
jgi:hypothetical protein